MHAVTGSESPPQYYLNVSDPIDPHPLFYFCIKHTAGDFWRFSDFNEQLAIGKHAQVVEVQCQREFEGKGAYPTYSEFVLGTLGLGSQYHAAKVLFAC